MGEFGGEVGGSSTRAALLDIVERRAQEYHGENDQTVDDLAEIIREAADAEENQDEGIAKVL